MKRLISFLLACFLLGSLCACGKEKDSDRKSDRDIRDEKVSIKESVEENTEPSESSVETAEPETFYIYAATDINNEGELIFYVTDEDGKLVTAHNGAPETEVHPFEPISEEGSIEYYGYKVTLPDGWAIAQENRFINEKAGHSVSVTPIYDTYEDYYKEQREMYDLLASEFPDDVSWTEDVSIGDGCTGVVRFTLSTEDEMRVIYFFENSGNVYKIFFESTAPDIILTDSILFCKAITYKPYQYYKND